MAVPASSVITSVVDLLLSCGLMAAMMAWYRFPPPPQVALLPLLVLMGFAVAFGAGVWISALTVKYRDFRFIIPFVVQFGLYVSPVGFTSAVVPDQWKLLYALNPMVGVIDGFRWAILGLPIYWPGFGLSLTVTLFVLATGIRYFRRTERSFADVI